MELSQREQWSRAGERRGRNPGREAGVGQEEARETGQDVTGLVGRWMNGTGAQAERGPVQSVALLQQWSNSPGLCRR